MCVCVYFFLLLWGGRSRRSRSLRGEWSARAKFYGVYTYRWDIRLGIYFPELRSIWTRTRTRKARTMLIRKSTWSESVSSDILEPVGLEYAVAQELLAVLDGKHNWAGVYLLV